MHENKIVLLTKPQREVTLESGMVVRLVNKAPWYATPDDGTVYMVAYLGGDSYNLINLKNGNRWSESHFSLEKLASELLREGYIPIPVTVEIVEIVEV
jgi:hypothetical protein